MAPGIHGRFVAIASWLLVCEGACGGEVLSSSADSGSPIGNAPMKSAGDGAAEAESSAGLGYCLYETCSGLSLCNTGDVCPVGDGCNTCACSAEFGGKVSWTTASTCTTHPCRCQ